MAKCIVCGKHGLFLKVSGFGRCASCEANWLAKLSEERRQTVLQEKRAKEVEEQRKKVEAEQESHKANTTSGSDTSQTKLTDTNRVTTSYRSPLAASRRGIFYCDGEPNLYNMSDDDFLLVIFLMYFAGWLVSDENRGSYDMQKLFPHPRPMFDMLLRHGWIISPDPAVSLSHMTVPELKVFAAEHGVNLSETKKTDIISCILAGAPAEALNNFASSHWYAELTPQGYYVLRSLYNERIEVLLRVSRLIQAGNTKTADLVAAAYWHKRSILTHPSFILDIPPSKGFTPVEACVIAAKTYFNGDDLIKVFVDYWGKHEDVIMHRGILEYLYPELS